MTEMLSILPIILAGGSGTRLWPLSREEYPKQLLRLTGANTLLQETVMRLDGIAARSQRQETWLLRRAEILE